MTHKNKKVLPTFILDMSHFGILFHFYDKLFIATEKLSSQDNFSMKEDDSHRIPRSACYVAGINCLRREDPVCICRLEKGRGKMRWRNNNASHSINAQ